MEFLYQNVLAGKNKRVTMEHKGEILEWSIAPYRSFNSDELVFGDINRAISKVPVELQDKMWEAYKNIHRGILEIPSVDKQDIYIRSQLKIIESCLPMSAVQQQVFEDDDFFMISDQKTVKTEEVKVNSFDLNKDDDEDEEPANVSLLTYTDEDFKDLNVLIIYVKMFMPVMSHYYTCLNDDIVTLFKPMRTVNLLSGLEITKSKGWERLNNFILVFWKHRKKKQALNPSILIDGLSNELAPQWLFAEIVMKRLLPVGISHTYQDIPDKQRPSFISGLFHSAADLIDKLTKNRNNEYYMDKGTPRNESADEEQTSKLESYRVTAELNNSSILTYNVFCADMKNILNVYTELTLDEVDQVQFNDAHHSSKNTLRTTVMGWVLSRAVSPGIIKYLDEAAYGNCFIVAYSLLNKWGFPTLAKIMDSRIDFSVEKDTVFNLLEVTAEQVKEIREFYPHEIETNRVKGESKRSTCYPILACMELQDEMKGYTMRSFQDNERWVCNVDIQYELAKLIIHMNKNRLI